MAFKLSIGMISSLPLLMTMANAAAEGELHGSYYLDDDALGRQLKGSGGRGGGRSSFGRSYYSGSGGGSNCTGDDCPEWYVSVGILVGFILLVGGFLFIHRKVIECIRRRRADYVEPPKNDAEMAEVLERQATWFKNQQKDEVAATGIKAHEPQ